MAHSSLLLRCVWRTRGVRGDDVKILCVALLGIPIALLNSWVPKFIPMTSFFISRNQYSSTEPTLLTTSFETFTHLFSKPVVARQKFRNRKSKLLPCRPRIWTLSVIRAISYVELRSTHLA